MCVLTMYKLTFLHQMEIGYWTGGQRGAEDVSTNIKTETLGTNVVFRTGATLLKGMSSKNLQRSDITSAPAYVWKT